MKYINVFANESDYNEAKPGLSVPQLSYAVAEDKLFSLSAGKPLIEFEMVDLGLSQQWANMNVGATCAQTKESWYGNYYSWAEAQPKLSYDVSNYSHWTAEQKAGTWDVVSVNKYNDIDEKTVPDVDDNPAQATTSAHRMPSETLYFELFDSTKITREWKTDYMGVSGLNGFLFTSKVSGYAGNSIFIPSAGMYIGATCLGEGETIYMWSEQRDVTDETCVHAKCCVVPQNGMKTISSEYRSLGMNVREVSYFI